MNCMSSWQGKSSCVAFPARPCYASSWGALSVLHKYFGENLMVSKVLWPARSSDLSSCDFYLWGKLNKVFIITTFTHVPTWMWISKQKLQPSKRENSSPQKWTAGDVLRNDWMSGEVTSCTSYMWMLCHSLQCWARLATRRMEWPSITATHFHDTPQGMSTARDYLNDKFDKSKHRVNILACLLTVIYLHWKPTQRQNCIVYKIRVSVCSLHLLLDIFSDPRNF